VRSVKKVTLANLHIRLPVEEKIAFGEAARKSGFDVTTWVRLVLRKAARLDQK
jgi:hypothetical protein